MDQKAIKAVAERVAIGAKRYDFLKPDWWTEGNVDMNSLYEGHPRSSVVGQNRKNEPGWDGRFDCQYLGLLSVQEAASEGFYFTVDKDGFTDAKSETGTENGMLTEAWMREIIARRKTAGQ